MSVVDIQQTQLYSLNECDIGQRAISVDYCSNLPYWLCILITDEGEIRKCFQEFKEEEQQGSRKIKII
jgi:hypothetical protein